MFRRYLLPAAVVFSAVYVSASSAEAGMPSLQLIVTELGKRRLEEVSFFLIGFLVLTGICRWLWNGLTKDIPSWPRLSYRGALSLMLLWGLAMTVVLSLISGARELMTPAAWEPNGITHRLVTSKSNAPVDEFAARKQRLLLLKKALWDYAGSHDSHFPSDLKELDAEVTIADLATRLPYFLAPDVATATTRTVLISEPDIHPRRLLLLTDGSIVVEERDHGRTP